MGLFWLKSLLTYYGGKFCMRERIVDLFTIHDCYCEPFAGGAAVYLHKPPSEVEYLNDLDNKVVVFWQVCKDKKLFPELQELIAKTLHSRKLHNDAKALMKLVGTGAAPSLPEQAWAFWYLCNGSFMGMYGGQWAYKRTGTGSSHADFICEKRQLFTTDAICQRLERTGIECQPANQVIQRYDAPATLFYIDPPYFNSDMGSYIKQAHGKAYSQQDFNDLLAILSGIKGKFILSCYPSELVYQYARDFGWSCDSYNMDLAAQKIELGGARRKKTECLFYNFNSTQTLTPTLF
jgi:DNA adenine methylase